MPNKQPGFLIFFIFLNKDNEQQSSIISRFYGEKMKEIISISLCFMEARLV